MPAADGPPDPTDASVKESMSSTYVDIAQLRFTVCSGGDPAVVEAAKQKLLEHIKTRKMAPFYKSLCERLEWPVDQALLTSMETANAAELASLQEKLKDAVDNLGESEIRDAHLAIAEFYMRTGEKQLTLDAMDETFGKTVAMGPRLDLLLSKLRVSFFFDDLKLTKATIEKAKSLLVEGGDWERRNRLKVYEAVFLICIRDFKKASALLLDSIATFTATELVSYNTFVMYTVLTTLASLPRAELKKKVVDAPEILQVLGEIPYLGGLLNGLYSCQYRNFMASLLGIIDAMTADRYLSAHARYYWREVRVLAYSQFLESYRSVSLASMAETFGVDVAFLDSELSGFIAEQRLSCSIDKVAGVVSSTRPDSKNAQYQDTLKKGDMLLNRVQKLSRVINL